MPKIGSLYSARCNPTDLMRSFWLISAWYITQQLHKRNVPRFWLLGLGTMDKRVESDVLFRFGEIPRSSICMSLGDLVKCICLLTYCKKKTTKKKPNNKTKQKTMRFNSIYNHNLPTGISFLIILDPTSRHDFRDMIFFFFLPKHMTSGINLHCAPYTFSNSQFEPILIDSIWVMRTEQECVILNKISCTRRTV